MLFIGDRVTDRFEFNLDAAVHRKRAVLSVCVELDLRNADLDARSTSAYQHDRPTGAAWRDRSEGSALRFIRRSSIYHGPAVLFVKGSLPSCGGKPAQIIEGRVADLPSRIR